MNVTNTEAKIVSNKAKGEEIINYTDFGSKLKEVREMRNMTQKELSEAIDVTENFIARIEINNGGHPSITTIVKLCNALQISMDYLLSESLNFYEKQLLDLNGFNEIEQRYILNMIKEFKQYKRETASFMDFK